MSRFNHRNNKQRFDLYSFYSLLVKCKVVELLDGQGNTPFDSDTIDQNVWNYAAYLYKDISDAGLLSYLDSDSFRSDSDGQGTTTWPSISKTAAITEAYRPLRRFMYSLDSDEGINNTANTITPGFVRKYYTLPLSDSEGSLRHVNIYSFLKTHVDRWLQFDPYERRKLASRIIDNMSEDSDVRYRYSHNFLRASEEDSDLARRLTEIYSNVLQSSADSDSDYARNEFIKTTVTALRGLTPGGDSDAARDLANVITGVLNNSSDSDSEIRKQFGWHFLTALYRDSDNQDSDLQNRLRKIIENTELLLIDSPLVVVRKLMPMDSDDTGSIGDSDNKFALANFTTLRTDELKKEGLNKDRLVDIDDSEGKIGDTGSNLQWQGDSELTVTHVNVTVDARLSTARVSDLSKDRIVYSSDSDGRTSTSSNLQWQDDSELVIPHLKVTNDSRLATSKVTDLYKDRIVYSSDSDGRLRTNLNIQFQNNDELVVTNLNVSNDSKFNATRVTDIRKDGLVFVSDSDGRLNADSDLEFTRDSDKLVLSYQGRRQLALDSEKFFNLLIANDQYYTLDSEGVNSVIVDTPVKSQTSWVIGQRGDVYFISEDPADSEIVTAFTNSDVDTFFTAPAGTGFTIDNNNATYNRLLTLSASTPQGGNSTNIFYEVNTTVPGGIQGAFEITWNTNGYGFLGFSVFPTSAAIEADNRWINNNGGGNFILDKNISDYTYMQVSLPGAVSGSVSGVSPIISMYRASNSQSYSDATTPSNSYDVPNPTIIHMGRDDSDRLYIYVEYYSGGSYQNGSKYYYHNFLGTITTSAADAYTLSGGVQLGYGNYDFYPVTVYANLTLTGNWTSIKVNKANTLETKSLVYVSDKVVDTQAELSRAINDTISKQVVFDTWYKFSHQWTGGGTPGTFTYPSNVSELNGWAYDAVADKIYTTVNANSYCGFVSTDTYQNFTFDSTYKSFNDPTNDDDTIASIVGFVTEGIFGQPGYREHTLQLVRVAGGFPMTLQNLGNVQWALVYNYNQDDVRLLVDKTTSAPVATAPWNSYPNGTKVWIRRQGDIITAYCSQMNDATYTKDSDTEIIFDLSSDSDTLKFRGPVRYGYGVHSQRGASWNDVFFKPDQGTYLHYITDGQLSSVGGNVYEYNIDTGLWNFDSELTINNTVGNRLLFNKSTGKTFYNDPATDKVYKLMTARKFSDIINLPTLTSEPDSDMLGFEGLKPGTFAIADGVNWDPTFYGAPAYVTFWDGEYWYYVDAQ